MYSNTFPMNSRDTGYRSCVVAACNNSTKTRPDKLFFRVPRHPKQRKIWFRFAGKPSLSLTSTFYFCEDHFDLENDMCHYARYKRMGSLRVYQIKPGCIPSKFESESKVEADEALTESAEILEEKMEEPATVPAPDIAVDNSITSSNTECIFSSKLTGRRIVDIGYLLEQMASILQHGSSNCKFADLAIIDNSSLGLSSAISFKCKKCGFQSVLITNPDTNELNNDTVLGIQNSGLDQNQVNKLFTSLNIPKLSIEELQASQDSISEAMQAKVWHSMKLAAEEEAKLAHQESAVDSVGRPLVPVVIDSNPRSDKVVIFGQRTRKILFYGVANEFCTICARDKVLKLNAVKHQCFKIGSKLDKTLRNCYVYEGFAKSKEMYGVIFNGTLAGVAINQDLEVRKAGFEESACFEDLLRDYNAKLTELTVKREDSDLNVEGSLREELKARISSFGEVLVKAVMYRRTSKDENSVKCELLRKDIRNLPSHVFDEHELCAELSSYCNQIYVKSELVLEMRKCGYFDEIVSCSEKLQENVGSLLEDLEAATIKAFNLVFNEHCEVESRKQGTYGIQCLSAVLNYNQISVAENKKNVEVYMETDDFEDRLIKTKIEVEDANLI